MGIRGKYKKDRVLNEPPLFVENLKFYVSAMVDKKRAKTLPLVYRVHPFIDKAIATGRFKRGPDAGGLEAIAVLVATGNYVGLLTEHRSEERSVGKGCVSTCRSRWWPCH